MKCPNCGQEVDEELFCFNCGTSLKKAMDETEEGLSPLDKPADESSKSTSLNGYAQYLLTYFKQPSNAKNLNEEGFIYGMITMGLFGFMVSLFVFISLNHPLFGNVPFFQFFVMPLLAIFAMQLVVAGAVYGALYMMKADVSLKAVFAQFGGYVIPFLIIYLAGFLLSMLDLNTLSVIFSLIGTLGALFVIPALILKEELPKERVQSVDFVYLLFGIYALSFIFLSFTMRVYMRLLIPAVMGL